MKPDTSDEIHPWATVTRGSARVKASTRTVRVVLARDLAARTNLCELSVAATPGLGAARARAAMEVRRGPRRGCRPGPRERVVHESDTIRVTTAHVEDAGASTSIDGYRACRRPRGNLQRVERAGDSGGAGGSATHRDAVHEHRDVADVGQHAHPPLRLAACRPPPCAGSGCRAAS